MKVNEYLASNNPDQPSRPYIQEGTIAFCFLNNPNSMINHASIGERGCSDLLNKCCT